MPFATWWRGDPLPDLVPPSALSVQCSTNSNLIAQITHLPEQEINKRIQNENLPYIAFSGATPVAYGWVAKKKGGTAELQFSFPIPPKNGYLWSFLTLPQWRGQNIYPCLLQAIIQQEADIERFWIGYVPGNDASARGIKKAGFQMIGDIIIADNRVVGMALSCSDKRAPAIADFFQLPINF